MRSLALACCALMLASGCATSSRLPSDLEFQLAQPGVVLSSQPPGAEVWVDGRSSGFTTPCVLDLDKGDRHRVEFRLAGYASAVRDLEPHGETRAIPLREARVYPTHWGFPLFSTLGGALVPIKRDDDLWPSRVHVRLRLAAEN